MSRKIIASLATALLLAGCNPAGDLPADGRQLVRVKPVEHGRLEHRMSFSATLQPVERARLAFQSAGILTSRPVRIGSAVRKGELLATLDNPELAPAQRAAAAALQETLARRDQARRDLARLESLEHSKVVGEEAVEQKRAELDAYEAALSRAQADLSATSQRLEDASLVAPFDGVISNISAEPGEFVAGGQVIMVIGGLGRLEFEVLLPAALVSQVSRGDETGVRIPQVAGLDLTGRVTELAVVGDPQTGLFPAVVEIAVDPLTTRLRPGMLARAGFRHREAESLIVPLNAVVDPMGGDPRVYRFSEGQVSLVLVGILGTGDARVAVARRGGAPLGEGDLVVTAGHHALTDGQEVRIAP